MNALWAFLKPFLKDKGLELATDKSVWVIVLSLALQIANKSMNLGFDQNTISIIATGVGGWLIIHFSHKNTVGKE